jgi:hypothetical protein
MTPNRFCIYYTEDEFNPGAGDGTCLTVQVYKDGKPDGASNCRETIMRGICPKKRSTPYEVIKNGKSKN